MSRVAGIEREREIREPSTCIVVQKEAYRAEFLCSMGWFFVRSTTCNFFFLVDCLLTWLFDDWEEWEKEARACLWSWGFTTRFFQGCFFHPLSLFGHICCLRSLTCKAVLWTFTSYSSSVPYYRSLLLFALCFVFLKLASRPVVNNQVSPVFRKKHHTKYR